MENYASSHHENIFKDVEVLIYVFDVQSRGDHLREDLSNYQTCLSAVLENSPSVKVFCIIHKMDLVIKDQRDKVAVYIQ